MDQTVSAAIFAIGIPALLAGAVYLYLRAKHGWGGTKHHRKLRKILGPDAHDLAAGLTEVWEEETAAARSRVEAAVARLVENGTDLTAVTTRGRPDGRFDAHLEFEDGTRIVVSELPARTLGTIVELQRHHRGARIRGAGWRSTRWTRRKHVHVLFELPGRGARLTVIGDHVDAH